tara:strand:+ start:2004 stop:2447 length:444 start_codon:yes stop_codon:yes gene_type:complete
MAMVNVRDVLLAVRRRFLTIPDLPSDIQYDGQTLTGGLPPDKVSVIETLVSSDQQSIAFGTSQALGLVLYEVVAPASRPDLVNEAYSVAHAIIGKFENGITFQDTDGVRVQVVRSETINTGRRSGDESDLYFVPALVSWRSFSTLDF